MALYDLFFLVPLSRQTGGDAEVTGHDFFGVGVMVLFLPLHTHRVQHHGKPAARRYRIADRPAVLGDIVVFIRVRTSAVWFIYRQVGLTTAVWLLVAGLWWNVY